MTLNQPKAARKTRPLTFVSEIPTQKLSEFWGRLERGELCASKCSKCGYTSFPPVADCPRCLNSEPEWVKLDGTGEIESFTRIAIKPASFAGQATYTVVLVKMKEGVKVLAWLNDAKPDDVKVGARVSLVTAISEHGPSYAFTLRPD